MKKCSICGETKPLSHYYERKNGRGGVYPRCRQCEQERNKSRKGRHSHSKEINAKKNHRRRGVKTSSLDMKIANYTSVFGVCLKCGTKGTLQYDHVVPIALGGIGDFTNLQMLCADCNIRKGATYADYRHKHGEGVIVDTIIGKDGYA